MRDFSCLPNSLIFRNMWSKSLSVITYDNTVHTSSPLSRRDLSAPIPIIMVLAETAFSQKVHTLRSRVLLNCTQMALLWLGPQVISYTMQQPLTIKLRKLLDFCLCNCGWNFALQRSLPPKVLTILNSCIL